MNRLYDLLEEMRNAGLVLAVFIVLLLFAHHSITHPEEAKFAEFCLSKSGEAFAAFLGFITGRAMFKPPTPQPEEKKQ